jgi:hypothetical protein
LLCFVFYCLFFFFLPMYYLSFDLRLLVTSFGIFKLFTIVLSVLWFTASDDLFWYLRFTASDDLFGILDLRLLMTSLVS